MISEDYSKFYEDLLDKLEQVSVLIRGMLGDMLAMNEAIKKIMEEQDERSKRSQ